jgi:hypothetical protein
VDGREVIWFEYSTWSLGVFARAGLPLAGGVVEPYVEAGGGLATAATTLTMPGGEGEAGVAVSD